MTLATFRDVEVKAFLDLIGKPYLVGSAQNEAINRALEQFTQDTFYFYSDNIPFTVSATATYALRDTSIFAEKVWDVTGVWIDGSKIWKVSEQRKMYPWAQASPAGKPWYWWMQGVNLVLNPAPSGAINNCYVSGFYLHPTLTQDTDALAILDTDIRAAALEAAVLIGYPYATGDMLNIVNGWKQELSQMKAEIKSRQSMLFDTAPAVSRRSPWRYLG